MKQFKLKNLLLILSIFITLTTTNNAFAKNICRGENITLNYMSANVSTCSAPETPNTFVFTGWNPQPGQTSSVTWNNVQTAGNFSLTCVNSDGVQAMSVENITFNTAGYCHLNVLGSERCPAGQVPDTFGSQTITETYSERQGFRSVLRTRSVTVPNYQVGTGCVTPTATITGGSCIIPIGASSCTVPVSFTTTNLSVSQAGLFDIARTGASSNNYYNGFVYGGTSYMSIPGRAADQADVSVGGGTPITLRVNSMSGASTFTVDGSGTVTGNCATGSAWNGSMCTPSTVSGSVTANNCTVAFGQSTCTSPISWTSSGYNPDTVNLFGCCFS
jgi:hypothetical protein